MSEQRIQGKEFQFSAWHRQDPTGPQGEKRPWWTQLRPKGGAGTQGSGTEQQNRDDYSQQ